MTKEPKKRISIGVPLDMLEKIERIIQAEYHGFRKVQSMMLTMIDIGFLAADYYGGHKIARAVLEREIKEQKQEPGIIPSCGMILEFPLGKRLSGSQAKPTA